jgi:hypothetical protein
VYRKKLKRIEKANVLVELRQQETYIADSCFSKGCRYYQVLAMAIKPFIVNCGFTAMMETVVMGMVSDPIMQILLRGNAESKDQQHRQRQNSLYDRILFQL